MIKDHQGNEFSSVEEMANHYGLDAHKLFERLQVFWWPVERALTENIDSIRKVEKAVKKIDNSSLEYTRPEGAQPGTLAYERPDLLEEWDYEKNNELGLDPTKLLIGSHKKAWWTCKKCNYNRQTIIRERALRGVGCAACVNKVVTSTNNLAYCFPIIAQEFNSKKNDITPDKVVAGSNKKYWWVCKTCGFEWQTAPINRTSSRKSGCPACKNQTVSETNNLAYLFPELALEFDSKRNGITPNKIVATSAKRVWWKCKAQGHEWETILYQRTRSGSSCPYCKGRYATTTSNLQSLFPDIAKEFNIDKNKTTPDKIAPHSNKTYWWKCSKCSFEWTTTPGNRTRKESRANCPNCTPSGTSFPEQALYFYVKKYFKDAINRDKTFNFELDIYIPSLHTAIEYDGIAWHKHRQDDDIYKTAICKKYGINLIRIREEGLPIIDNCITISIKANPTYSDLSTTIKYCLTLLDKRLDTSIDVSTELFEINKQIEHQVKQDSLQSKYPIIAAEFYSLKNGITPDKVTPYSNKKYWWKCSCCDNIYLKIVNMRTQRNGGCPVCAKNNASERTRKAFTKENKILAKLYPELIVEYSPSNTIASTNIAAKSRLTVKWICQSCNKEWEKRIDSRTNVGVGCPYCGAGRHPEFRRQRRYIDEQGNLVIEEKE